MTPVAPSSRSEQAFHRGRIPTRTCRIPGRRKRGPVVGCVARRAVRPRVSSRRSYMGGIVVGSAGRTESAVASDDSLAEPSDAIAWADVDDVIVLHASGGTTELFRARRRHRHINGSDGTTTRPGGAPETSSARWDVELLSASEDLYAGQFIDRSGVRLGLPFPPAHISSAWPRKATRRWRRCRSRCEESVSASRVPIRPRRRLGGRESARRTRGRVRPTVSCRQSGHVGEKRALEPTGPSASSAPSGAEPP